MATFKNGFVITMQYNEKHLLPIWIRHYSKFFTPESIYVIDHGSDENYVPDGVNRIHIPRTKPFNEDERRDGVKGLVFLLMQYYTFGIFCDTDELINLDRFNPEAMSKDECVRVCGFDLFKFNLDGNIRIGGLFNSKMCKPLIFNHSLPDWPAGFHGIKQNKTSFDKFIIMGHIKYLHPEFFASGLEFRKKAYHSMDEIYKICGIDSHWIDQDDLNKFYRKVQTELDKSRLCSSLSNIPMKTGFDKNGYEIILPSERSYIYDLTEYFENLL